MVKMEERWSVIIEFPNYLISDRGRVMNRKHDYFMRIYPNQYGHMRITLTDDDGKRFDRSVVRLVAQAFVDRPNTLCDHTTVLDGNLANVDADNIIWRPRWFVWKYAQQLKHKHPLHYRNLRIMNEVTEKRYDNVLECGIAEGLLFDDVWRSTFTHAEIFPTTHSYCVA